jgi:hypothetical protein
LDVFSYYDEDNKLRNVVDVAIYTDTWFKYPNQSKPETVRKKQIIIKKSKSINKNNKNNKSNKSNTLLDLTEIKSNTLLDLIRFKPNAFNTDPELLIIDDTRHIIQRGNLVDFVVEHIPNVNSECIDNKEYIAEIVF